MKCNSCEAIMINGVYCHEIGCPDAPRKCTECGSMFKPSGRQTICDDCRYDDFEEYAADYDQCDPPSGVSDGHFDQHHC